MDDVNDNAPILITTTYTSNVMENLGAGQLVCKVDTYIKQNIELKFLVDLLVWTTNIINTNNIVIVFRFQRQTATAV